MDSREFFQNYISDRREQDIEGFNATRFAHLVRYTPSDNDAEGLVTYTALTPGLENQQIQEQIEYFSKLKLDFEWKVYDFDQPNTLMEMLKTHSFIAGDEEAFMVCILKGVDQLPPAHERDWEIRRVDDLTGIRDVVYIQELVWKQKFDWLVIQLHETLVQFPHKLSIYCAYDKGVPIGTGWVDFPDTSEFPELHGGAVLEEWRGRGVYSDLYTCRLVEAAKRGYKYLTVDASTMSRPILEKLGFKYVCTTFPMRRKFA